MRYRDSVTVDLTLDADEFVDVATRTWSMVGNSAEPSRTLHIVGTKGEVFGTMEEGTFTVRRIAATGPQRSTTEEFAVSGSKDMHGGGDLRLVADFVNRSEEHTSELQSRGHLVCRLLLEKK